jgi:hypothetical protein
MSVTINWGTRGPTARRASNTDDAIVTVAAINSFGFAS